MAQVQVRRSIAVALQGMRDPLGWSSRWVAGWLGGLWVSCFRTHPDRVAKVLAEGAQRHLVRRGAGLDLRGAGNGCLVSHRVIQSRRVRRSLCLGVCAKSLACRKHSVQTRLPQHLEVLSIS